MKDMIFGYIIGWLIKIEDTLRKDADDITEEQYSKIMLELDRVRSALAHCKYGKPNGNNLAPNSGHQPSCDGNCIATRGQPKDMIDELANDLVVHNCYNEASGRYIPLPNDNYTPSITRILQGANSVTTNKQAQGVSENVLTADQAIEWQMELEALYTQAQAVYDKGLALGVPKELARLPVPVSRYSSMRASCNLRNWLHFLSLRMDAAAQWEIREYANAVCQLIEQQFPRTRELFAGTHNL